MPGLPVVSSLLRQCCGSSLPSLPVVPRFRALLVRSNNHHTVNFNRVHVVGYSPAVDIAFLRGKLPPGAWVLGLCPTLTG